MTKRETKPKINFDGLNLTVTEATSIELKNPDIVEELLRHSNCELKKDTEDNPIIVWHTFCHDLVPPLKVIESAQKDIKEFESKLRETDTEVERIKFIVERLPKKES